MAATRLSAFIRENIATILTSWDQFAKDIPAARHLDLVALRDHAKGMLLSIADDLDRPQTSQEQEDKSKGKGPRTAQETYAQMHGSERKAEGFSISEAISEFRALRASVIRLWSDSANCEPRQSLIDTTRFNEAIDQVLTASLDQYSTDLGRYTRLFNTLLSTSPNPHSILGIDGRFIYVNEAFTQLLDTPESEIIGKSCFDLGIPDASRRQWQWRRVVETKTPFNGEMPYTMPSGKDRIVEYSFVPVIDEDDNVEAVACSAQDITERRLSQEKLNKSANYDALTGLPNRSFFQEQLQREVRRSARNGLPFALFFIDLDRFKDVNDRLGHGAGDQLLKQAAQRISACVRDTDMVARLGGDEFTVILTDVKKSSDVEFVAKEMLDALAKPFFVIGKEIHISSSIGITLFPQDAATSEDLIRNADQAMYVAKDEGKDRYHYFTLSMQQAAEERGRLIEDLRAALTSQQLRVYYQPIVNMKTGITQRAEALVRWQHPVRGMLDPDLFISLAEETGMIVEIGDWVFRQAALQVKRLRELHDPQFQISVNKSSMQFRKDSTLYKTWIAYLQELNLPGDSIIIEITESLLMDDGPVITTQLDAFRNAGIQMALDDFGTGYSSLSYLKDFDLDSLKIDQSFVRHLTPGSKEMALCEAIIVMAHKLGLKVVAEGVETAEKRDWLHEMGCDYAQGYLFSKPVSPSAFEKLLNTGAAHPQGWRNAAYRYG